jgi:hypothetical protein
VNIGDTFAVDNVFFKAFISRPHLIFQYLGTAQEQDRQMCRFLSTTTTDYFCGEPGDVEKWLENSQMWSSAGWGGEDILLQEVEVEVEDEGDYPVGDGFIYPSAFIEGTDSRDLAGLLAILAHWQFVDSVDGNDYSLRQATADYVDFCGVGSSRFAESINKISDIPDQGSFQLMTAIANYLAELF